jgi:hypothetical protein
MEKIVLVACLAAAVLLTPAYAHDAEGGESIVRAIFSH